MDNNVDNDDDIDNIIDNNNEITTTTPKLTFLDVILMPVSIQFMDYPTLSYYLYINKLTLLSSSSKSYWIALCTSFSVYYGLYTLNYNDLLYINAKKHFFNELLMAKNKFLSINDSKSFNIKVSARFRPGQRFNENVNLPLHQFLKVRRKNIKESSTEHVNKCLVGEQDPEEYLDPLLGTLMTDPVLLKTSGRIVDRSTAVKCILRGGKDPFNNKKLVNAHLEPQPELADQIRQWKEKKKNIDISVAMNDVKKLGDSMASDPELLAILMEADRLSSLSKRASQDARAESTQNFDEYEKRNNYDNDDDIEYIDELIENNNGSDLQDIITSENDENVNSTNFVDRSSSMNGNKNNDGEGFWKKNSESAKVVDINEKKSCVSMMIGGVGVRNFSFANVNDSSVNQTKMYEKSAQESIIAALNGFNACLLCYGQTGSGKTYTLFGPDGALDIDVKTLDYKAVDNSGIVIRAVSQLLDGKERLKAAGVNVSLAVQFVEIYNEECVDLLNGRAISIRRDNGELVNAVEAVFDNMSEAMEIINTGQSRKRFAATAMNERSSRSHTAFIISITQIKKVDDDEKLVKSYLHLVDLAGSERIKKSRAVGKNKVEAVNINSSLLVLGKYFNTIISSKLLLLSYHY